MDLHAYAVFFLLMAPLAHIYIGKRLLPLLHWLWSAVKAGSCYHHTGCDAYHPACEIGPPQLQFLLVSVHSSASKLHVGAASMCGTAGYGMGVAAAEQS